MRTLLFAIFYLITINSYSQQPNQNKNTLFTAGFANAFIGGLYDGFYPYSKLKQQGNFGLGAPDKLDGELLLLNGRIYQTQHTGKTFEVKDLAATTPFSVVNYFEADKIIPVKKQLNKAALFKLVDSIVNNSNAILAIHLKGSFKSVKTRAFPPAEKPYIPLAQILDKQQFFNFKDIEGDFVGYNIPSYMEGANITGYHFHFLSQEKNAGGHVIDFVTDKITIEIDFLNNFAVSLPQTPEFQNFDFKQDRSDEVKSVENGKRE